MKRLLFIFFIFISSNSHSQDSKSMTGEYYLQGVRETASGFKLNADTTFMFFLSYGALDRYGSGKWKVKDHHIIFNTTEKHGQDFALVTSKRINDNFTTIKISEGNEMLQSHVYCILKPGEDKDGMLTNKEGEAKLPAKIKDSISLIFEFVPERISTFAISDKKHNYFEFKFQPWIFEVYFDDFSLEITEEGLSGRHPLMEGEKFRYVK